MAIVEGQKVKVKWHNNNKHWYINKGYKFTHLKSEFEINCEDLSPQSNFKVKVKCDNPLCENVFERRYSSVLQSIANFCSKNCSKDKYKFSTEYSSKKFDKKFLISEFWRYFDEFGVYPKLKDLRNTDGFPSQTAYKRVWGYWENFLKEIEVVRKDCEDGWYKFDEEVLQEKYHCSPREEIIENLMIKRSWDTIKHKAAKLGLKRNLSEIRKKVTNEFLLDELKRFYLNERKSPTYKDFETSAEYPHPKVYLKRFESWNNALRLCDLELNTIFDYTKEGLVTKAKNFYIENSRSPFIYEIGHSITSITNYWNSWSDFLIDCELPLNRRNVPFNSNEEGLVFLQNLSSQLGKIPTTFDCDKAGIQKGWFTEKYGSFKQALFEANLIDEELLFMDTEKMIENSLTHLKDLSKSLNRIPIVDEYVEYLDNLERKDYVARETLCLKLNRTFTEICQEYLPEDILNSPLNNCYLNSRNEICKSLAEKQISDIFINNNIEYVYEPPYKEVMDIKMRYRFDWKLIIDTYPVYVEYFGLIKTNEDYEFTNNYLNKANIKMQLCKDNGVTLLALYPNDLKDNYSGLVNKLKQYNIDLVV
jgi:hypothetical protein